MYWFLSGFTAKLAGTEIGVKEPQPTFSACFGAPFLPQPPGVYARLLARSSTSTARRSGSSTPAGRAAVRRGSADADQGDARAAPRRALGRARRRREPDGRVFGFDVPVGVPGVDAKLLDPRGNWPDPRRTTRRPASSRAMFRENFTKFDVDDNIVAGGPPRG